MCPTSSISGPQSVYRESLVEVRRHYGLWEFVDLFRLIRLCSFFETFGEESRHILECTAIQFRQKGQLKIAPSLIGILEGGQRPRGGCPVKGGRDAFCL